MTGLSPLGRSSLLATGSKLVLLKDKLFSFLSSDFSSGFSSVFSLLGCRFFVDRSVSVSTAREGSSPWSSLSTAAHTPRQTMLVNGFTLLEPCFVLKSPEEKQNFRRKKKRKREREKRDYAGKSSVHTNLVNITSEHLLLTHIQSTPTPEHLFTQIWSTSHLTFC